MPSPAPTAVLSRGPPEQRPGRTAGLRDHHLTRFLKGEDTGFEQQPRVSLNIRHPGERFELCAENLVPLHSGFDSLNLT
jgi:hypothetical protein